MGSKFQYDESGSTFFYFLLSFEALVVIPCTYYFYPRNSDGQSKAKEDKTQCNCDNCRIKESNLKAVEPWRKAKERFIKFLLIIGWIALVLTAYKVGNLQQDYVAYDPFEILEISPDASMADIKKAYRRLSLVYHPDKAGGNEKKFMMLTKAYAALTDEEAKRNWHLYGNPDGPGAMSFGIALPSWIVEKKNSVWVLGLYALVFMVVMPVAVGIWWYRRAKFGTDAVLLDTTQLYLFFLYKTPHMIFRRVIMVLGASMEFRRTYNNKIIERPSDNVEVPQLIKQLSNVGEKNKEKPLCFSYSLKARTLIHAHLSRMKLPRKLDEDKMYIIKKLPNLIQEFVQCAAQLTMLALAGRISRMPHLDTMEHAMRLCACVVQAMWDKQSPFLQLPHITEEMLRHFISRKRNIRTIRHLASMKASERKAVLRTLSDDEYQNVINVISRLPVIDIQVRSEVLDDVDSGTITSGDIVTVTATLIRNNMSTLFDNASEEVHTHCEEPEHEDLEDDQPPPQTVQNGDASPKLKRHKLKSKKKKMKGSKLKKKACNSVRDKSGQNAKNDFKNGGALPEAKEDSAVESEVSESDYAAESDDEKESNGSSHTKNKEETQDDDAEWAAFQEKVNRREKKMLLEAKSKKSHVVHCPLFPSLKHEYWWIYIADKKKHSLITAPYLLTNLVSKEEVELKFTAPSRPGIYTYSVIVRSDSYVDVDVIKTIKLDVKEAKEVDLTKLQWDVSENEEEKDEEESAVEDSDLADSDDDDSDD